MPIPTLDQRRDGLLRGLGLLPPQIPPASGEQTLGAALLESLGEVPFDFVGLVAKWTHGSDVAFDCPVVATSIGWLAATQTPITEGHADPGLGAAVVTLALAASLHGQPAVLLSGTYHLARILDPHPLGIFAAVTGTVTAACFLAGRSDFVPDVLEVLLVNEAPPQLVDELRRVPVWATGGDGAEGVVSDLGAVLWALRHHSSTERAIASFSGRGPSARRLGLGLVGARDGAAALSAAGVAPVAGEA